MTTEVDQWITHYQTMEAERDRLATELSRCVVDRDALRRDHSLLIALQESAEKECRQLAARVRVLEEAIVEWSESGAVLTKASRDEKLAANRRFTAAYERLKSIARAALSAVAAPVKGE